MRKRRASILLQLPVWLHWNDSCFSSNQRWVLIIRHSSLGTSCIITSGKLSYATYNPCLMLPALYFSGVTLKFEFLSTYWIRFHFLFGLKDVEVCKKEKIFIIYIDKYFFYKKHVPLCLVNYRKCIELDPLTCNTTRLFHVQHNNCVALCTLL